uniref:Uncharacterized protein n=1 Tax=Cacopsylla melanoneura TaxID=428564 RepID=A0A8D8M2F8_9HEMI
MEVSDRKRLEAAEKWRRMTKTRWIEKINERVLEELQERRHLMKTIETRKIKLVGHIIRHNEFINNIFEGKVPGKKSRGRPRKEYFKEFQSISDVHGLQLIQRVEGDRDEQRSLGSTTRHCL